MKDKENPSYLATLPSAVLETKLKQLRQDSAALSQSLTQKLANSQSGQNLLHIGPSLSTLPPDLSTLLTNLSPLLDDVTDYERANLAELTRIVDAGTAIRLAQRRADHASDCTDLLQDLMAAETNIKRDSDVRLAAISAQSSSKGSINGTSNNNTDSPNLSADPTEAQEDDLDELDHVASLERAAHTTLHLVHELRSGTADVMANDGGNKKNGNALPSLKEPLPDDTEKGQFLMKLAPRIRRLEASTVKCLTGRLELILTDMKRRKTAETDTNSIATTEKQVDHTDDVLKEEKELLMIGQCLRGLALLGRGKEAENTFARVAIMPLIRSKISMGRLDEGGSRGECAGLFSLLDDMACSIASTFGPVLELAEAIFDMSGATNNKDVTNVTMDVDLVTAGVWIPIATALSADPAIKMAIFSPGIASILQANYTALDIFLSELASNLLKKVAADLHTTNGHAQKDTAATKNALDVAFESLYFKPEVTVQTIQNAQERIYRHPMTAEFAKKWNLPIYYQLRFGECCSRLNKALTRVQDEGWMANVFTGSDASADALRNTQGFELPVFMELYDILLGLWKPDVILRPLASRFLRGAMQLIGRTLTFVTDGLEGRIKFQEGDQSSSPREPNAKMEGVTMNGKHHLPDTVTEYCWGERLEDVASVAWELTVLETCMTHDYRETIIAAIAPRDGESRVNFHSTETQLEELREVVSEVLVESAQDIAPMIQQSWNDIVVSILTVKCCTPLSAVKGVAATYRMTNRPPPSHASPFVATILRPLKEFDDLFANRTPPQMGIAWKESIVGTVSTRYSVAVEELISTVQRTEVALKNRKARRTSAGGMSDGEKVKLQLYLDHKEFAKNVQDIGLDIESVEGVQKLASLTVEAESLYLRTRQNGKGNAH